MALPMASATTGESRYLPLCRQERHREGSNLSVRRIPAAPSLRKEVHPLPHRHRERVGKKFTPSVLPIRKGHRRGLLRGRHHLAQLTNSGRRRRSQTLASSRKCQLPASQSGIEPSRTSQIPVPLPLPDLQRRPSKTKRTQDQSSVSHHLSKEKENHLWPLHPRQVELPRSRPHGLLERPLRDMLYRLMPPRPLRFLRKVQLPPLHPLVRRPRLLCRDNAIRPPTHRHLHCQRYQDRYRALQLLREALLRLLHHCLRPVHRLPRHYPRLVPHRHRQCHLGEDRLLRLCRLVETPALHLYRNQREERNICWLLSERVVALVEDS